MTEALTAEIGLATMLAPLAGDHPVGADLRQDFGAASLYYRLRDARAEARAAERVADAAQSPDAAVPPEWRLVRQLAVSALTEKTKDLEIAAWLTEALVRSDGISGMAVGARLLLGLTESFWEAGLYPSADEDGVVTRVAPVTGLNGQGSDGTLIQPLRKQVFLRRADGTTVAFWEYDAARKTQGEADAKKRQAQIARGVLVFADLERDAQAAGPAGFVAVRQALEAAASAWAALGVALDAVCGRDGPPTGRVSAALGEMIEAARRYAPAAVSAVESLRVMEEKMTQAVDGPDRVPVKAAAGETREDMLRELARIADYFRRTEPHSPLAYTLDDAVRRARMSWPELLAEIVPDAGARGQMLMQLGIKVNGT